MSLELHTVEINPAGSPPSAPDRLTFAMFRDQTFPASAAALTALGAITAGTGFRMLPLLAPTGGTLTGGVSPADPAQALATSLKAVTATVATAGLGVAINDTFALVGGTLCPSGPSGNGTATAGVATVLTATHIQAVSAVVLAAGTGGTPGAVTITGTTGTGTKFQATGTISAGGNLTGPLTITVPGDYTANPTIAGDAITGGSLTGATVTLVMGALTFSVSTAGGYTVPPAATGCAVTNVVGTGTGVTANPLFGLGTAVLTHSGNYSGAPSFTVTPADGNGTGASIAAATLGGNGAMIPRALAGPFPGGLSVAVTPNIVPCFAQTILKNNNVVSVGFTPIAAASTLAAGSFDAIVAG